ncbi:uncharacterized protein LOC108671737 [Hyalella azteca]|uniref:Uncharacterized protein LOC108671737 n=1 Tax=Hyalella azteca TaxID=294128 RepID=A0A8B7NMB0_HYAAZ|nr:uncharacterized protein LOC108671737 [Hyalella azteca]
MDTKNGSAVSSSISSAPLPLQSHQRQHNNAALGSARRQAPLQPAAAAAAAPCSRILKSSSPHGDVHLSTSQPVTCTSSAHGRVDTIISRLDGATTPEKIELSLLKAASPHQPSVTSSTSCCAAQNTNRLPCIPTTYISNSPANSGKKSAMMRSVAPSTDASAGVDTYTTQKLLSSRTKDLSDNATKLSTSPQAHSSASQMKNKNPVVGEITCTNIDLCQNSGNSNLAYQDSARKAGSFSQTGNISPFAFEWRFDRKYPPSTDNSCPVFNENDSLESLCIQKGSVADVTSFKKNQIIISNVTPCDEAEENEIRPLKGASETAASPVVAPESLRQPYYSITQCQESFTTSTPTEAIRPQSLQSNIIVHIKPEAISSVAPRNPHTALQMEFGNRGSSKIVSDAQETSPNLEMANSSNVPADIRINMPENSPAKDKDCNAVQKKPTSFLTELLSHSSSRRSSKTSNSLLKFWVGNKLKNKKQEFGSTIAMAGSNSSNSDSNASEMSEKSSLTQGLLHDAPRSGQFPTGRLESNTSTLGCGETCSLLATAPPAQSHSSWYAGKFRWLKGSVHSRSGQTTPSVPDQPPAPCNPEPPMVPDADQDDDEAWFDSVTKLNEEWFKPGAVTLLSSDNVAPGTFLLDRGATAGIIDTPVGKSDIAALRSGVLFDAGHGYRDNQRTLSSAHNSTTTDLLHFKAKQLTSNSSLGSLSSPPNKSAARANASSPELVSLSSHPRGLSDGYNYRPLVSASIASSNANKSLGSGLANNRGNNNIPLRKLVHIRAGLRRPHLQRRSHASLIKTNIDDAGAVKEIEAGLLHLMEEFQAGKLTAFGNDRRRRQMEAIREQQESLARLHQEVGGSQDLDQPLSAEALEINTEHMSTLMEKLACLSVAIEKLENNTAFDHRTSAAQPSVSDAQVGAAGNPQLHRRGPADTAVVDTPDSAEPGVEGASEEFEGVVLRKKGASALLQKSLSLGRNASSGDIELSKIKKRTSSVVRSSSQKHYDHRAVDVAAENNSSIDPGATDDQNAKAPGRPASVHALGSSEASSDQVIDSSQHRHRHHHRHRHSHEYQKVHHHKKGSNEIREASPNRKMDVRSVLPTDHTIGPNAESTEMRVFDAPNLGPPLVRPPAVPARTNRPLPSPLTPAKQGSPLVTASRKLPSPGPVPTLAPSVQSFPQRTINPSASYYHPPPAIVPTSGAAMVTPSQASTTTATVSMYPYPHSKSASPNPVLQSDSPITPSHFRNQTSADGASARAATAFHSSVVNPTSRSQTPQSLSSRSHTPHSSSSVTQGSLTSGYHVQTPLIINSRYQTGLSSSYVTSTPRVQTPLGESSLTHVPVSVCSLTQTSSKCPINSSALTRTSMTCKSSSPALVPTYSSASTRSGVYSSTKPATAKFDISDKNSKW